MLVAIARFDPSLRVISANQCMSAAVSVILKLFCGQFFYKEAPVRIVMQNDEPWFVAKDICDVLEINQPIKSVQYLDDDEKSTCLVGTSGQNREMLVVNEPGLYSLVLRSRKPEAKAFKRKYIS